MPLPVAWRENSATQRVNIRCNEDERDVNVEPSETIFAAIVKAFDTDIKAVLDKEGPSSPKFVKLLADKYREEMGLPTAKKAKK